MLVRKGKGLTRYQTGSPVRWLREKHVSRAPCSEMNWRLRAGGAREADAGASVPPRAECEEETAGPVPGVKGRIHPTQRDRLHRRWGILTARQGLRRTTQA